MALHVRVEHRSRGFRVTAPRRFYAGSALAGDVSRAVAIIAGGASLVALFVLYLWAVSLGLPNS